MKTPLAWHNLLHNKVRTLVAMAGVAFAVMLVLMQLGFHGSVRQTATRVLDRLDFDILLLSPRYLHFGTAGNLPRRRMIQAQAGPGVESVAPLYLGFNLWTNPENKQRRAILVMGQSLTDPAFNIPEVRAASTALSVPGQVIMDSKSRPEFGAWTYPGAATREGTFTEAQLGGMTIQLVGDFPLGTGFSADGALICSADSFQRLFPQHADQQISMGLVRVEKGYPVEDAADGLRQIFRSDGDVQVVTRGEIENQERQYWLYRTSVGTIFGLGVVVGVLVGIAIVYQVLAGDISDHLPEYATLKAIGYGQSYLTRVILEQSAILGAVGFVPGFACSLLLYRLTSQLANISMELSPARAVTVLVLSVIMCMVSGLISLRKVAGADPAELF